jgi:DNA replication protein DnaC
LAAAIGLALIENEWRVLFTRTTDLVQKLQVARRELNLEGTVALIASISSSSMTSPMSPKDQTLAAINR